MPDYSFCGNIIIYCAASLGDDVDTTTKQLAESDYKPNILWQGALFFPHTTSDFANGVPFNWSSQTLLSGGSNWSAALRYIPAFGAANGVFNTRGYGEFYSDNYSPYFPGMTSARPGIANKRWHIVTCKNRTNAYVYETAGANHENCYLAEIQSDGSLITDTSTRVCMPRFAANSSYAYLHGCLIHGGVTENNLVTDVHDFHINAAWNDSTLQGRHIALFNRSPSSHAPTVEFLNAWPLNKGANPDAGGGGFDLNSFLMGYACGRQVKGWATRQG